MLFSPDKKLTVASVVTPGIFLPDIVNAHTAFSLSPNSETHLVGSDLNQFEAFAGWPMSATTTFDDCPDVDVLIVGATKPFSLDDENLIKFIKEKAIKASAVIGICYGVLALGCAGLLQDKRVTSNFHITDYLNDFGAIPVKTSEVVIDGNLYTAGPAHGCFEAAIEVLAALRGDEVAKMIELTLEYNPHPKYHVGSPELAGEKLTKQSFDNLVELDSLYWEKSHKMYQKFLDK